MPLVAPAEYPEAGIAAESRIGSPATADPLPLDGREIRRFWRPLVLNALLMTLSGPLLNVAIGRAAEPALQLAGFWIAFSVLMFIQSASLAIQQVAVVVADSAAALRRLAILALLLGLAAATVILALAWTPVGGIALRSLIPTTARVADLARTVLAQLAVVPILIAAREVAIGIAIKDQRTTLVATSTMIRIVVLAGLVGGMTLLGAGGARAAAGALALGVAAETTFILGATRRLWMARLRHGGERHHRIGRPGILRLAGPLAVAAVVWTSVRPVVSAILGRLPDSELAQAAFGIVLPILMVACSPLWALQHVCLVLTSDRHDLRRVVRSAAAVAALIAATIGVVALTPLGPWVLRAGFGLSPEMDRVVAPALGWLVLAPFLLAARAIAQGLLMKAGRTGAMLIVSPIKLVLMASIGLAVVARAPAVGGAILAVLLVMGGDLFDAVMFGLLAHRLIGRGLVLRVPSPERGVELDGTRIVRPVMRPAFGGDS